MSPTDLLTSIRAAPEDDPPRQVLADLYEENGDIPRAEFIRAQLAQASTPRWDPTWLDLELTARAPLLEHQATWRAELPSLEGVRWGSFERGLVRSIAFDDAQLVPQHAEAIMQACPVRTFAIPWPRLGDQPKLEAVPGLRELVVVGTVMRVEDMQWLANAPVLSTIESLRFVGSNMRGESFEALLASPHLARLRSLTIPHHDFDDEAIGFLVASRLTLHELDLSIVTQDQVGSGGREPDTLGEMGVVQLAKWAGLANLRRLSLTGLQIGAGGLTALLASENNANLRSLKIRSVSDYDDEEDRRPDVLGAFQHARKGLALDVLDIGENQFSPEGAQALRQCAALENLKVLHLDLNHSYGEVEPLLDLLQAPWMDSVGELTLRDNSIESLETVVNRAPSTLHTLSVASSFPWSSMGGLEKHFADADPMPALRALDLTGCALDDDALRSLGDADSLPGLISLRLGRGNGWYAEEPEYTEEGVEAFIATPLGKQLRSFVSGIRSAHDRLAPPDRFAVGENADQLDSDDEDADFVDEATIYVL